MLENKGIYTMNRDAKQAFANFYSKYDKIFRTHTKDSKVVIKKMQKMQEKADQKLSEMKQTLIDDYHREVIDETHTIEFKNNRNFKNKLVGKMVEQIGNRDEVISCIQQKKMWELVKDSIAEKTRKGELKDALNLLMKKEEKDTTFYATESKMGESIDGKLFIKDLSRFNANAEDCNSPVIGEATHHMRKMLAQMTRKGGSPFARFEIESLLAKDDEIYEKPRDFSKFEDRLSTIECK